MIDAAMMVMFLGTTAVALAVDVAVLVAWLRRSSRFKRCRAGAFLLRSLLAS
jgi:hypothetical protein